MISVSVPRIFKITERASVVELLFIKVTEGISAFYNSAENSISWISMFRKEALVEISRNSLLTGFLHLQSTGGNATKNSWSIFLGVFWKLRKISRNSFVMEFLFSKKQAHKPQTNNLACI